MTRAPIHLPGSYGLEAEIERRMRTEAVKPRGWAMQALWGWLTVLTGIGVGLAAIVFVMVMPVIWGIGKMRRAGK